MGEPAQLARHVWEVLQMQGSKLIKDGATLDSEEQNLQELTAQASDFLTERAPVLRALGVL
jgi:hypothetical protein